MSWPIYHPKTDQCVRINKNLVTLGNCDTNWNYKNKLITNSNEANINYKQTNDFYNNLYANKNSGTKFSLKDGNKSSQIRLQFKNNDIPYQVIGNINTLRTRPYKLDDTNMLDFESPIFCRDNKNLFIDWYNNPTFNYLKNKIKKSFKGILENDLSMMKSCCKHKGNKDLCEDYWGPSKACDRLLSDQEKINCCMGLDNIYKCGNYWGPNRTDKCNKYITNYCLSDKGYGDENCSCLITTLENPHKKLIKRTLAGECIYPTSLYFYMTPEENRYIQENFKTNQNRFWWILIILILLIGFLFAFTIK